ncbi:unnamed protein product [Cuscuta epithymum]|uniref:Uncharacterized protein n=1 Tax=Cuscuta epithymum TaxID=186058 RepID=A0AAV0CHH1_9ASTE|nr:unnamed protein product [Cuscuta epithymum]
MSSSRRGVNWSVGEDVVLCNAWVTISEQSRGVGDYEKTSMTYRMRTFQSFHRGSKVGLGKNKMKSWGIFKILQMMFLTLPQKKKCIVPTSISSYICIVVFILYCVVS